MVRVNGMELDIAGQTVTEYLSTTNYDPKRIAVERNGDIVFKSQYDATYKRRMDKGAHGTPRQGATTSLFIGYGCHLRSWRSWIEYRHSSRKSRHRQADTH